MSDMIYTVPQLAKEFGLTERAIRFYESKDLISPQRAGTTRVFNRKDRARLIVIIRAKNVGFSIGEIKEYLDLYDLDPKHKKAFQVEIKAVKDRIKLLKKKKIEIDSMIEDLNMINKHLNTGFYK